MKKVVLGTAVALLAASTAYAQDYQFEVGAVYVNGDRFGVDYDGLGLNGQFHFDKVDTSKGPLNEAAFLDKSSFVGLDWITKDYDYVGSKDTVTLNGRFVTKANVIVEANYQDSKFLPDDTIISVGVGMYLNDNMDAVVSYEDYDNADRSSLSAELHGINKLSGETGLAFDLGLAYIDWNNKSGYGLSAGADYYVDKALSIGAGLSLENVDNYEASTIEVRARFFVTPLVALGVNYETLGQDNDGDRTALSAALRF